MKQILFFLILLPFCSRAQECKLKKEIDQFSQQPRLTTGFVPFSGGMNRTLLSIDADNKEIDFFFTLSKSGEEICFDDESTATIIFEGGRLKSNFRNSGSMNCEGYFHFTFKNGNSVPSTLQRLATMKVITIQLKGRNKVTEINLKEEEQQKFMSMAACMIQEAKTLLVNP